jgi:hypothetical protein
MVGGRRPIIFSTFTDLVRLRHKRTAYMSDHWNSLANLLGTPSLSPQTKKSTDGGGAKAKEIAQPHEAIAPAETNKSAAKEPSKLRSGWDAVTSFFGIQSSANQESKADELQVAPEPNAKRPPTAKEPRSEAKPSAGSRSGKKSGKPSFWTEDVDTSVEPTETNTRKAEETIPTEVFASNNDEPVVSFGARKRERNDRRENGGSRREPRESTKDKSDTARQTVTPSQNVSIVASPLESDDIDGPVERRSQRRAPRRGRSDDLDEGAVETQSARNATERKETDRKETDRRENSPNRRSRSTETSRSVTTAQDEVSEEPVIRNEESRGNERPSRGGRDRSGRDRSGRDTSPRNRSDRDRPERTERTERTEREVVARDLSDREASVPDATERESSRRSRDRRSRNDDSRSEPERRRPEATRRAPVDEVGFGAGLRDSDDDDIDFVTPENEATDSIDEESSERSVEGPRRGRNQRRGRRSTGRAANGGEDAERMEADESEKKFIKVPSWIEALDGILQSNMDNHQRNNHSRDRNRGRGPRNNDR